MIEIKNISFGYKRKSPIFSNFSLELEQGKVYGLLGQNGAGKSTLLYFLSGLLFPQKGEVKYAGESIDKRYPSVLRELFIVPEEFELPNISLERYVSINSPFYPKFDKEKMYEYLKCFNMPTDIHLGALSMGQKKKVFMSFALATNTSLLLMDEPTNGLDIPSKSQFRKFMALGMTDEKTIIISTHQVQDVDKMLEHILIINQNEIMLNQSVSEITRKLSFVYGDVQADSSDVLFSLPTVSGNSVLKLNTKGDETPLNLELLYNAILQDSETFKNLFDNKTPLSHE